MIVLSGNFTGATIFEMDILTYDIGNFTGATIVEMDVLTCCIGKAISFNFKKEEHQHASILLLKGNLQIFNKYPLAWYMGKLRQQSS